MLVSQERGGNVILNAIGDISLQETNCLSPLTFYYENFRPADKLKVE